VGGDVIAQEQPEGGQPESCRSKEFEQFYRDNHPRVRRFVLARSGDRVLADEVADAAFSIAWAKWDEVRDHVKPLAWVYVTANNKLSEARRRESRCLLFDVWPEDGVEPNQIIIETRMVIDQIMADLAPVERQAMLLWAEGYSEREAAAILGLALHTYKTYKRDALAKARRACRRLGLDNGGQQ
jgi:RNA polymerase sigma factor (sigma-70 family)